MMQHLAERIDALEARLDDLVKYKKELMIIEEVEEIYGWSRRKIFQMRDQGVLKFYRFPNTRRRYLKRSEIEASFVEDKLELS